MDATLNYYLNRLEKAEITIKNQATLLFHQNEIIDNNCFVTKEKNLYALIEYARILDNYYEAIADACDLCIFLQIEKPPIFLYNLVKTLLETPQKYYHFLNEKLVNLGYAELPCNSIKDCEKIMQLFYDLKNIKIGGKIV